MKFRKHIIKLLEASQWGILKLNSAKLSTVIINVYNIERILLIKNWDFTN